MHKQLIVGAAAAALLAGPALAENTTPTNTMSKPGTNTSAQTATGTATGSMATTSGTGITRATKASAPVRYGSPDSTDLMSSKLVGVNVYNNQDEKIGEISDI